MYGFLLRRGPARMELKWRDDIAVLRTEAKELMKTVGECTRPGWVVKNVMRNQLELRV